MSILKLEIPVLFSRISRSRIAILIDKARLPYFLELQQSNLDALAQNHLITEPVEETAPQKRIDYQELAVEYREMLENGRFPTLSALALELGVSRAWVWKVLKR